ncbi:MAG: hypothetical protein M3122_06245 [Actinomycetota bacterium]|nr:hypothetical protein [Actinomycetota bacterium]
MVSADTLLNHIRSTRLPNRETPRVLSVDDDFAFRRESRYATVLVDLERRRTLVDVVLPDRSADTPSPAGSASTRG